MRPFTRVAFWVLVFDPQPNQNFQNLALPIFRLFGKTVLVVHKKFGLFRKTIYSGSGELFLGRG